MEKTKIRSGAAFVAIFLVAVFGTCTLGISRWAQSDAMLVPAGLAFLVGTGYWLFALCDYKLPKSKLGWRIPLALLISFVTVAAIVAVTETFKQAGVYAAILGCIPMVIHLANYHDYDFNRNS